MEPEERFLIIDGQRRLAALHLYRKRPEKARTIHVPWLVFDGRTEDFGAEMFVIINSTPMLIDNGHLVDLYEQVSWASPDRKPASRVAERL